MYDGKAGTISEEQKEYLKIILTSSEHLLHLINEILDLIKVESGKISLHNEEIDLEQLIADIKETFLVSASDKNISITSFIDPTLSSVINDTDKLKGIFYNYISNALKFTPNNGSITINVRAEANDQFKIEVTDNGIGIQEEDLKKLFVEFQQLDNTIGKKYQGSGLGLSLTKHIVEALGGTVGVTSEYGKGSTFYAILPKVLQKQKELTIIT